MWKCWNPSSTLGVATWKESREAGCGPPSQKPPSPPTSIITSTEMYRRLIQTPTPYHKKPLVDRYREKRIKEEVKTYKIVLGILYHQARRDWLKRPHQAGGQGGPGKSPRFGRPLRAIHHHLKAAESCVVDQGNPECGRISGRLLVVIIQDTGPRTQRPLSQPQSITITFQVVGVDHVRPFPA